MDLADIINSFATSLPQYQVTRRSKPAMVRGRAQPSKTTAIQISASVQPASGRDLLQLEEGRRSLETRIVFTSAHLVVGEQAGAFESDLIAIDGRSWETVHVESWEASPSSDGAFYRCIVQAQS